MREAKGQIQIVIIGLLAIGAFLVLNFTGILGGKKDEAKKGETPAQEETAPGQSPVGPQRSNLYPTGTLPAGTRETTISVSTNVAAYCRYDKTPGTAYNSMDGSFSSNREKTFHSVKAVSLETGETYEYYVRCRDMDNNKNIDDVVIRFVVGTSSPFTGSSAGGTSGGATSGAIPPVISNLYPTGTLPAGTMETQMSISTNEPAYCRYSTNASTSYSSMNKSFSYDQAKLVHTVNLTGLTDNKIYEYFIRCRDLSGNKNTSDVVVRFGIGGVNYSPGVLKTQDVTPPYRYGGYPDEDLPYSAKSTQLSLRTDEKAVCHYDSTSGVSYGQMRAFSSTNALTHSTQVSGFNEGETYKYYVKCADEHNNINTDDYVISFKVKKPDDVTPPVITVIYPYSAIIFDATEVELGIQTNESATCRYATEQGVAYSSMKKNFTKQANNYHTAKVTGLQKGVYYSYFIRCKDTEDNVNTGDIMISFRISP